MRYYATIYLSIEADNDQQAVEKAEQIKNRIDTDNSIEGHSPVIESIIKAPFGTMGQNKVIFHNTDNQTL